MNSKPIQLLAEQPLCVDRSLRGGPGYNADGECTREATHEYHSEMDGGWSAVCERCSRYWNPNNVRPLTAERLALHFFAQSRANQRLRVDRDEKLGSHVFRVHCTP